MVQINCTSAHSNVSLYCGFKELFVKGLKTANKVKGIVSSIMLLVILTKGCHLHTWGEKTIIHIILVHNFTSDTWPSKNLIFAQTHKSEGMLLQYSGAALVRYADIE